MADVGLADNHHASSDIIAGEKRRELNIQRGLFD